MRGGQRVSHFPIKYTNTGPPTMIHKVSRFMAGVMSSHFSGGAGGR